MQRSQLDHIVDKVGARRPHPGLVEPTLRPHAPRVQARPDRAPFGVRVHVAAVVYAHDIPRVLVIVIRAVTARVVEAVAMTHLLPEWTGAQAACVAECFHSADVAEKIDTAIHGHDDSVERCQLDAAGGGGEAACVYQSVSINLSRWGRVD